LENGLLKERVDQPCSRQKAKSIKLAQGKTYREKNGREKKPVKVWSFVQVIRKWGGRHWNSNRDWKKKSKRGGSRKGLSKKEKLHKEQKKGGRRRRPNVKKKKKKKKKNVGKKTHD